MQIKEFAELTGVSVRTLHYYDETGLLKPAFVDKQTGYRHYDEASLLRMQEILFYRELDFPLKAIGEILSAEDHDRQKALSDQKRLLTLKKQRLERLIEAVDSAMKGENIMNAFDNREYDQYKDEAKQRWGETDAYKEYEKKNKGRSKDSSRAIFDGMEDVMHEFALFQRRARAGQKAAGIHHRKLLCLYGAHPRRSWPDVRRGRALQKQHRQAR